MKANTASRYAVFLILLVLGQEFCVARYTPQRRLSLKYYSSEKRETKEKEPETPVEEEEEQEDEEEPEEEEKDEETGLEVTQSRPKRSLGMILLAVQLSFSIASLAFEIYNKIAGCCGNFPQACKDRDEFKEIQDRLGPISKATDAMSLKAVNRKEDVIQANYKLIEMWTELKRSAQLKAKNQTVIAMSYADIDVQFKSYLDNFNSAMLGMSTFMGYGLMGVSMLAVKYYKANQLNKMINKLSTGKSYNQLVNARHTKAAKILGLNDVGINAFVKETAASKVNARFAGGKLATFLTGLNIVSTLMTAGFAIYATVMQIQQCQDTADRVADSLKQIQVAEKDMIEVKTNVTDYYNYLNTNGWNFITDQVVDSSFQQSLNDIKLLAEGSATKTADITFAIASLGTFLLQINGSVSDPTKTRNLMIDLNKGLTSIKFLLKCYVAKGKLLTYVSDRCKNGTESMANLYTEGIKSFKVDGANCIVDANGTPYANLASLNETINNMAKDQGYNIDCILNSEEKKKEACRLDSDEYSNDYIMNKMSLTAGQLEYFLKNCPPPELTPKEKGNICTFKSMGFTAAQIVPFMTKGITEAVVQAYMDSGSC
ncbi:hypothetical protein QZH41_011421 [Actinostola sp. cb2023]|nr:hypothetical protein QZH41_011421 [Actinostola sp. cb2023]